MEGAADGLQAAMVGRTNFSEQPPSEPLLADLRIILLLADVSPTPDDEAEEKTVADKKAAAEAVQPWLNCPDGWRAAHATERARQEEEDNKIMKPGTKLVRYQEVPPRPRNKERAPNALALDRWIDEGWHVRRRSDLAGNAMMVWVTDNDAISTPQEKKCLVPSPNGNSQVVFCFDDPLPPMEVVIRAYDLLGQGDYAADAKATLRQFLGGETSPL